MSHADPGVPDSGGTESLLFDVFVLSQAVGELLSSTMSGGPLTPAEYAAYSVVFEAEALTPTAMAKQLSMPLTTVMDDLRVMEARGHLRRIPNPRDRRSYLVTLSGDGLGSHREASRRFEVAYQRFAAALPSPAATVRRQLRALIVAAQQAADLDPVEPPGGAGTPSARGAGSWE